MGAKIQLTSDNYLHGTVPNSPSADLCKLKPSKSVQGPNKLQHVVENLCAAGTLSVRRCWQHAFQFPCPVDVKNIPCGVASVTEHWDSDIQKGSSKGGWDKAP